jgi:hypothetical protein
MPIRSFIGATVPLGDDSPVIPGGESVDDSRFVVRYFRKSADGRLLFGGREAYTSDNPTDISSHIRRQIAELYPALKDVEITHAWGGSVGITLSRRPFVREVMKNVTSIGGFLRPRGDAVELLRQALCRPCQRRFGGSRGDAQPQGRPLPRRRPLPQTTLVPGADLVFAQGQVLGRPESMFSWSH